MAQRYRVFIDRKVIEFVEDTNNSNIGNNSLVISYSAQRQLSNDFIDFIHNNDQLSLIVITGGRYNDVVKDFNSFFRDVKAAGGIVRNTNNDCLFIKRHSLWDLPKGKLEKGEIPEHGALREVAEETGLSNLAITSQLPSTFHIYTDKKGGFILKETFWFEMMSRGDEIPVPQHEEDITEVKWFAGSEIKEATENTYASLKELLLEYFNKETERKP
jgi:ADP-ribose pyrophosphatase YjhB (NUDIX family)